MMHATNEPGLRATPDVPPVNPGQLELNTEFGVRFDAARFAEIADKLFLGLVKRGFILTHGAETLTTEDFDCRFRLYREALLNYLRFVSLDLYIPARQVLREAADRDTLSRIESSALELNGQLAEWVSSLRSDINVNDAAVSSQVTIFGRMLAAQRIREGSLLRLMEHRGEDEAA